MRIRRLSTIVARAAVVLLVLLLEAGTPDVCAQTAAGARRWLWRRLERNESLPAAPDALTVDFGPVGYIAGRPVSTSIHVRTAYAKIAVLPEHLSSVVAGYTTNRVTLTFRNGDTMDHVALLDPLRLDTALGPVTLAPGSLARAQPDAARLNVAVQLSDGTRLTGEPTHGAPRHADGSPISWADILRLDSATNGAARFTATTTAGASETAVSLSTPFQVTGPFGTLTVPPAAVTRILVLSASDPGRPQAPLGNVAAAEAGAVARAPRGASFLNDGDWLRYDTARGFASGTVPCDVSVRFAQPFTLSLIRFLLWDRDRRSYRYTVEVSPDGKTWELLADRSDGWWRSWQSIAFSPRPVRALRVRGLSNSVGSSFDVVELEAYCHEPESDRQPMWNSGVPDESVERLTPRPRDRVRRDRPGRTL